MQENQAGSGPYKTGKRAERESGTGSGLFCCGDFDGALGYGGEELRAVGFADDSAV